MRKGDEATEKKREPVGTKIGGTENKIEQELYSLRNQSRRSSKPPRYVKRMPGGVGGQRCEPHPTRLVKHDIAYNRVP